MKLNSLILKSGIFFTAATLVFSGFSCSGDSNTPENPDDITEDTAKVTTNGVLNVNGKLFSIPSPVQTAMMIQKAGAEYDKTILNPTANLGKYTTDFYKALNLGIYGADLGYVTMYNKNSDVLGYLGSVKKLSDDIGVSGAFDQQTMKRIESNITVKDSMLVLVGIAYRASDQYLKGEKKDDVSGLILTGGWLESLNFAIQVNKAKPTEEIKTRIAQQRQSLSSIISLLSQYETQPEYGDLVGQLKDLQKIYDGIEFKYVYEKPETDVANKTTTLNSHMDVNVTAEQLNQITAKIQEIRDKIINPTKA
ncbi:MAG: hypothetical protein K0S33_4016 [Bacteroidetes bacterium]|jgi:hypothetical protein|nr:hypothetical protein [Bacteroidota bacterium]